MDKFGLSMTAAIPVSWYTQYGLDYYVFSDWAFLKYLIVLVTIDTILGVVKHYKTKDLSSKAFGDLGSKLLVYTSVMIMANVLTHFSVGGEEQTYLQWFGTFCCTSLIIREALSIIENVEAIFPGFFPKWIIKRLQDFNSDTCKYKFEKQ